jgi:hypothetical protein
MFEIYRQYCEHKQFDSVMPLFEQQFRDVGTEIVGYFSNRRLVAFSLIKLYDRDNAEAVQFAWDYANPKLRLGIESLKNECAIYKARGYKYKHDAPLATRVVRAVFGLDDRRRVATYSTVVRQAQKENIGVADLAKWIEDGNGVQEISLGKSATYIKPADKAEIAKNNLKGKTPIGYAQSELLSHVADAQYLGDMCVLLAEQQADGSFGVYAVLRQDGLVKSAFTSLYAVGKEIEAKAKAEIKAANDADGAIAKSA